MHGLLARWELISHKSYLFSKSRPFGHPRIYTGFSTDNLSTLGRRVRHSGKAKYAGFRRVREDFRSARLAGISVTNREFLDAAFDSKSCQDRLGADSEPVRNRCRQLSFHNHYRVVDVRVKYPAEGVDQSDCADVFEREFKSQAQNRMNRHRSVDAFEKSFKARACHPGYQPPIMISVQTGSLFR